MATNKQWPREAPIEWEITDNAVYDDAIVSLFAVNPAEEGTRAEHVPEYSAILEDGVFWRAPDDAAEPRLRPPVRLRSQSHCLLTSL